VKQDAVFVGNPPNLREGLNGSDFIVGVHYAHEHGPGRNGAADVFGVHHAGAVHGNAGYLGPEAFEETARGEDGGMLDLRSDDVVAAVPPGKKDAFERVIVGFRAAAGEDDLVRRAAQQICGLAAGLFDCRPRGTARQVLA
jgi:hypothetical protein